MKDFIGIFDSGIGGLTVYNTIKEKFPNENIVYLADTKNCPYGIKTLEEGKQFLKKSNIKPHGTNKINEAAREEARAQIRAEQQRNEKLTKIREDINTTVNQLYELGLISEADMCMSYYPLTSATEDITKAENIINFIKKTIENNDKYVAKTKIARWEIYNEYLKDSTGSVDFRDAKNYAFDLQEEIKEDAIGQYLINRNIVDGYPESAKLFSEPELLENIMTQVGKNKDLATKILCKYENYKNLPIKENSSILNILKIFNFDNAADKIALKYIIENDYILQDTSIIVKRGNVLQERTICDTAKQELFEKYNFPNSIPYFEKFELALPLDAPFRNAPGVKKFSIDSRTQIMEIKISGHDDRLVSENGDYRFNKFDPLGYHS